MREFVEETGASGLSENGATETDTAETVIETEPPLDEEIAESPDKPSDAVTTDGESDGTDYAALARADAEELRAEFPELSPTEALRNAFDGMMQWLTQDYGLDSREVYIHFSANPDVIIHTYQFTGSRSHVMGVEFPKKYL